MISVYSVISSIIFYNLGLFILFVLRRKTSFISRYAISTLLLLSALSIIRLLIPIDIAPIIIRSEIFVPKLIELLDYKFSIWPLSIGHSLAAIWIIGIFVQGFKICSVEYRVYKDHRIYPKIRSEQLKRVSSRLDRTYNIVLSPKVSQPYTMGIIKPVIYLPYIKYSDDEMYYVLLHEVQHIKSWDNLNRLLFLIAEAVFWWNPIAHYAVDDFELLTEFNCDLNVTAQMDELTVVNYLSTIVSVSKSLNPDEGKAKPKLALMFAQTDDIKKRFEVLLQRNDRKPKRIKYAVWLLMLAIFVSSFFVIMQPYYSSPTVSIGTDLEVNQEHFYIVKTNETYFLFYDNQIVGELIESELTHPPLNKLTIIGE